MEGVVGEEVEDEGEVVVTAEEALKRFSARDTNASTDLCFAPHAGGAVTGAVAAPS